MIKKNSMFIQVLVPVLVIMLSQTLLISLVLFANGTIWSLEENAVEDLRKSVENRSLTLENIMVHNWSNLDRLEEEITAVVGRYAEQTGLAPNTLLRQDERANDMLHELSEELLRTLRTSASTGAFLYFVPDADLVEMRREYQGLYYRDLSPLSTPSDHSDILLLRGPVSVARKDKIPLDSLWSEGFTFLPSEEDIWRTYAEPLRAARAHPMLPPSDLGYWSSPHKIDVRAAQDEECITYTRPVMIDGRIVAIMGTDVKVGHLVRYFPAADIDSGGQGGYMLVEYDKGDEYEAELDAVVYSVTGSYIQQLVGEYSFLRLVRGGKGDLHTLQGVKESVHVALRPLSLYSSYAPHGLEQWALASIGTDKMLFSSSKNVSRGILTSSGIALLLGVIGIAAVLRVSTRPLHQMMRQIERSEPNTPIVIGERGSYETALLCQTINTMREKQRRIEMALREERERHLIALESAAQTFVEYDLEQDLFRVYYFLGQKAAPELYSQQYHGFLRKVETGAICHPDDVSMFKSFLTAQLREPIELRIRAALCDYIENSEPDGDYYWFYVKVTYIGEEGYGIRKLIGTAREVSKEKRKERARIDAARRDPTTGLYNPAYGLRAVRRGVEASKRAGFCLCVLRVDDFERIEAYYGRVFGGVVMAQLSRGMAEAERNGGIAVRLGNDEFLLFFPGAAAVAESFSDQLEAYASRLYIGENRDLRLRLHAGIADANDGNGYDSCLECAYRALQYAVKNDVERASYGQIPPHVGESEVQWREKPVSVVLDRSREGLIGFVFDFFERTSDIPSAIQMLLQLLGSDFSLRQVLVCSYDADFGADHVAYQWNGEGQTHCQSGVEKIRRSDLSELQLLLDENGELRIGAHTLDGVADGVRLLLRVGPHEPINGYCCVMYENGVQTGRIIFKAADIHKIWDEAETAALFEITKIISARMSIDKSNTASKAKSEFLSRVSHEIRTPMNAIIGMTAIAEQVAEQPVRLHDCLRKIDFSAKHLLSLINDVLDMARIESGKIGIENAPFSLGALLEGLEMLLQSQFDSKGIRLAIENQSRYDRVVGDESRLRQVLVNLLGNAVKFTGEGGVVTLSVSQPEDNGEAGGTVFSVRDTGVGISKEDQLRIFRAFEQAGVSARGKREGTGLGLTISSGIVNAMGGEIKLQSRPGEGSCFTFSVELEPDVGLEKVELTADAIVEHGSRLRGKRVLLVEDNDINTEIAQYMLESVGIVIDTAVNGKEAVERFFASERGYYDAILMDIQMPVMDGLTAAREIRKRGDEHPDARGVPIIAMTANAFDEDMKMAIESGMNGHIAKPIESEVLYALLAQFMCG